MTFKGTKKFSFIFLLILGGLAVFIISRMAFVSAAVPGEINFQGKITDINGVNIANGNYNFQVRIYDDVSAGTAQNIAPSTGTPNTSYINLSNVAVQNGIFNLKFSPNPSVFNGSTDLYLQVCFDSPSSGIATGCVGGDYDKVFSPRKKITSNPYSLLSQFLGSNLIQGGTAADAGNGVLVFTGTDTVATPSAGNDQGRIYFDSSEDKFKCSENGNAFFDCFGASGITSIGTINGQTKSSNGAVISGNTLYMQTADSTNPGLISTGIQTIAGAKTFTGGTTISGGNLTYTGSASNGLLLNPYGAGAGSTTQIKFAELAANGGSYVGFKGPDDAGATNSVYVLPTLPASTGILKSTNTGIMSWDTNSYNTGSGANGRVTFWTGTTTVSSNANFFFDTATTRLGIGNSAPSARLDITGGNINIPNTTAAAPYGVITKNSTTFLHDFNYGNNGTVTTIGQNLFLGTSAGNLSMGSTATSVINSSNNTGIGYYSLNGLTTGSKNTGLGTFSLSGAETGISNTAVGYNSLALMATGSNNTAIGSESMQNSTNSSRNTSIGVLSLEAILSGSSNVAVGYEAGRYVGASGVVTNTTGSNSLFIGEGTRPLADAQTNQIVIGYSAVGAGSNSVVLGNDSITTTLLKGSVGIGTNPVQKLDVAGNLRLDTDSAPLIIYPNISVASLNPGTSTSVAGLLSGPSSRHMIFDLLNNDIEDSLAFRYSNANNAVVDKIGFVMKGNGRVGIGNISPSERLSISGNLKFGESGDTDANYTITVQGGASAVNSGNGRNLLLTAGSSDNTAGKTGGYLFLRPGVPTTPATAYGNVVIADLGGNVGVGTISPGTTLHVNSSVVATATVNSVLVTRFTRPQSGGFKWGNAFDINLGSYGTAIQSQSKVDFRLANGDVDVPDTTVLTLNANGSVDITGLLELNLENAASTTALCHSVNGQGASNTRIRDCTGTPAADYMEFYPVDNGIEEGDILVTTSNYVNTKDGERISRLSKSTSPYQFNVLGIASNKSKAGDFNSIGYNIKDSDNPYPIALSGRVYVKIDPASAPINAGDPITTSNLAGRGMKALGNGFIVGKALEDWTGQDRIMVFVNYSYYTVNSTFTESYFNLSGSNLSSNYNLIINGQVKANSLAIGNNKLTIDLNGNVTTLGSIEAKGGIKTGKITIDSTLVGQESTVGSALIEAGSTSITITNANVSPTSKIFITGTNGAKKALFVTNKASGTFTVEIDSPAVGDITFDYWIVDVSQ